MPELYLPDLNDPLARDVAGWHVAAVLAFPKDEQRRRELLVAVAGAARRCGHPLVEEVYLANGGDAALRRARPVAKLVGQVWDGRFRGLWTVGLVLANLWRLAGPDNPAGVVPTLEAAVDLLWCFPTKMWSGEEFTSVGKSKNSIYRSWGRSKPVAHLALAYFGLEFFHLPPERRGELLGPLLPVMLARARYLQTWAMGHRLANTGRPVLDRSQLWAIPAELRLPIFVPQGPQGIKAAEAELLKKLGHLRAPGS